MKIDKTDIISILLFLAFSVLAFFASYWSMSKGIGVNPDSTVYISVARSIMAGRGFHSLGGELIHYPPSYPLLLSIGGLLGNDLLLGARILNSILFFLCALIIAIASYISTKKSIIASLFSLLMFVTSAAMASIFTMAWSEPLFLLSSFLSFFLLSLFIVTPKRWLLFLSSLFVSLASTTRYAGISLLAPMVIALLILGNRQLKDRIVDCVLLLLIGCLPLSVWLLRNYALFRSSTGRSIVFHPIEAHRFAQLINTLYEFFLPIRGRALMRIPPLILAGAMVVVRVWDKLRDKVQQRDLNVGYVMQMIISIFTVTYLLFLIVSISIIDAYTPLNERIISPLLFFLILLIPSLIWNGRLSKGSFSVHWGFLLLFIISIGVNTEAAFSILRKSHSEGLEYSNLSWQRSDTINYVRSLTTSKTIYSNGSDVIFFLTGKSALQNPKEVDPTTRVLNPNINKEMNMLRTAIIRNEAIVVYFDAINWRWFLPTREKMENTYHLPVLLTLKDGVVYGVQVPQ